MQDEAEHLQTFARGVEWGRLREPATPPDRESSRAPRLLTQNWRSTGVGRVAGGNGPKTANRRQRAIVSHLWPIARAP
jgi:hypothetical protein